MRIKFTDEKLLFSDPEYEHNSYISLGGLDLVTKKVAITDQIV